MGTGAIVWTWLALSIHQTPIQEYPMNSRGFKIPITLNPNRAQEVRELNLYVSRDRGATWEQVDRKLPVEQNFVYHAPTDGSYWFIVQQVNKNGQAIPEKPDRVKPNMAVLVDTTRPQVQVTAERSPSGEIRARWKITEANPDVNSVRLEYWTSAVPENQDWPQILPPAALEGSKDFHPGQAGITGVVRVRIRVRDQAGNAGEDVFVVPAAGAPAGNISAAPMEVSPFNVISGARSDQAGRPAQLTSQSVPRSSVETPPTPASMPPAPTPPAELSAPGSTPPGGLPIANSGVTPASSGGLSEMPANSSALKIVRSREVRLDFTVAKVGPSGLGKADIYVTLDKGASWTKMPTEVPITLSPNTDNRGSESVSGSVSVQLPREATVYGFIVAVKSKAGRAPSPPKPGDAPEALVELDTTSPKGQLFRPQPDPSQPNTLLLSWEAKDRNLADKPITLEWAEQKDGPWTVIGDAALPNSGPYPWRLPAQLPPCVYLRLTMRDLAGNESRAQTDKPELIDLSVPETKIIRVEPNAR